MNIAASDSSDEEVMANPKYMLIETSKEMQIWMFVISIACCISAIYSPYVLCFNLEE